MTRTYGLPARVLAVCLMFFGSVTVSAAPITFDLSYSGALFGNTATGVGSITFDDSVLPNDAVSIINDTPASLGIVDFSITIAGASSGNGTFGLADFAADPNGWLWILDGPLDFGADLVGQANFIDFNWCAISAACGSATAPGGIAAFTIAANGEFGDALLLTSMVATQVPVPAAVWLFASAVGMLGLARRRKAA